MEDFLYYSQSEGSWATSAGQILITGCISGNDNLGKDLNNPASQFLHSRGPLPAGLYTKGPYQAYIEAVHSPGFFLTPDLANDMRGRGGFYGHDENVKHVAPDGTNASSDGCIAFKSNVDLLVIAQRPEKIVKVVAQLPELSTAP